MRRRIIVFGSRSFNDYQLLEYKLDRILINSDNVTIISGCARGPDRLGERYATRKGYGLIKIPAKGRIDTALLPGSYATMKCSVRQLTRWVFGMGEAGERQI